MASNGGGSGDDGCKVFKISSSSSLKIQRGDITKWSINGTSDAIVNAANERMLGGGGVDGAIHRAAGPELRAACYTVPEVRPGVRCPKGEARITPGFKLPVSHVIYTVGPIYDIDNHPEVTLRNAYRNCIKLAKESNIDYIAFPAISCRVYGVLIVKNRNDGSKVFKISSSSSLKIKRGDITAWSVNGTSDAIVNTANEKMLGGGGLDGVIHGAAGPELREACYNVPEVRLGIRCPKGEARITPAFQLPVSHVIHTVGPFYDDETQPEVILRNAYRNCIKLAKESNIDYFAFPAISCGTYHYPLEEAATIAISTVLESDGDFKEVHFVLLEEDVFNAWLEKANGLL